MMNVSTVTIELSELRTRVLGETDTSDIPVYKECCTPERRWPEKVSSDAHAQVVISDNQWNSRDCCFGVCKKPTVLTDREQAHAGIVSVG